MSSIEGQLPTRTARIVSFLVLVGIIVVIGVMFFRVVANFLVPLFLATLLVVIFRPMHNWIEFKCRGRQRIAAGVSTAAILLIVLVPAGLVITLAVIEGASIARQLNPISVRSGLDNLRRRLHLEIPFDGQVLAIEARIADLADAENTIATAVDREKDFESLNQQLVQFASDLEAAGKQDLVKHVSAVRDAVAEAAGEVHGSREYFFAIIDVQSSFRQFKVELLGGPYLTWIKEFVNPSNEELDELGQSLLAGAQPRLLWVGGKTTSIAVQIVVGVVIMGVALYFFLLDGAAMIKSIMVLSPLDDRYEEELFVEFGRISRAVMIATLLSAAVQGLLAGVGFWLSGLESVFLLVMLTTVMAMIPFVGAAAVWIPASLWLIFFEERLLAGVLLAVYGAAIISMADNVIKPMVLHGQSNIHPLLALISVLGGVQALGPIGILVGPMVVAFLQALLKILRRELMQIERRDNANPAPLQSE